MLYRSLFLSFSCADTTLVSSSSRQTSISVMCPLDHAILRMYYLCISCHYRRIDVAVRLRDRQHGGVQLCRMQFRHGPRHFRGPYPHGVGVLTCTRSTKAATRFHPFRTPKGEDLEEWTHTQVRMTPDRLVSCTASSAQSVEAPWNDTSQGKFRIFRTKRLIGRHFVVLQRGGHLISGGRPIRSIKSPTHNTWPLR
jgi:hypothetical protein